jgi:plasmid maintenance system antidote protein VapI
MKTYSADEILNLLRLRVENRTQKEVAATLGFTPQFLNDVLAGRRDLTDNLALALGFERNATTYIPATRKGASK